MCIFLIIWLDLLRPFYYPVYQRGRVIQYCAGERNRTSTMLSHQQFLRLLCIPFQHPGLGFNYIKKSSKIRISMAMLGATELKNGTAFLYEGKPFKVLKYELNKMGRGGAVVRVSCSNLETGANVEHAFSSNLTFPVVDLSKQKLQYLYKDDSRAYFMNPASYDQVEIPLSVLGKDIAFVKEGEETVILFWGEKPLSVELSPKIVLKVTETDPGVKGNSATNIYKPAVLENGLKLKVPLFINTGDKIRVDTRTGEYIERQR